MEKSSIISALLERVENLEKWRTAEKKTGAKKPSKEDEEVCKECGGDLLFVEEGVVYCPKCKEYYEYGEEKEE